MIPVRILSVFLCLSIAWAQDGESTFEKIGGGVRGPRIVEHKSQSSCQNEKNWPICADDDWGTKCPSGCRIQGLIDEKDREYGHRTDKIKRVLSDSESNYKSANRIIEETVNILKPRLDNAQQLDETYDRLSQELRRRIVTLKQRVVTQVNRIKALQSSIQEQVVEMKRLEVDIDIKIRACKGTCARSFDYKVDKESYDNIQKQLAQANSIDLHPELETATLSTLKMRPLKDSNVPDHFKRAPQPEMQALNIINNIKQMEVVLERPEKNVNPSRGDSSYHTAEARGDGPPYTSKLVLPAHGRETLSLEDKTSSLIRRCTKTTTKKIVSGPDGVREVAEKTVSSDGSECSYLPANAGGEGTTYRFSGADASHRLETVFPELESFFAPDSPSTATKHVSGSSSFTTSRHTTGTGSSLVGKRVSSHSGVKDKLADLGEEEEDDFRGLHLQPSGFPSGSASHSKTVATSSSSFSKGGYETKSLKTREIADQLGGVEQDQSAEDTPDFQARSFKPSGGKRRTPSTGKGSY